MNLAYQVYSQVASQLQVARAKVQEEKPVFAVLEPAVDPQLSSGWVKDICITIYVFGYRRHDSWIFIGDDLWNRLKGIR